MGILIDIIIIAIVVLSTFLAYKKGLIAQAIKLLAVIIAVIATLLLYRPVANFIINTTINNIKIISICQLKISILSIY